MSPMSAASQVTGLPHRRLPLGESFIVEAHAVTSLPGLQVQALEANFQGSRDPSFGHESPTEEPGAGPNQPGLELVTATNHGDPSFVPSRSCHEQKKNPGPGDHPAASVGVVLCPSLQGPNDPRSPAGSVPSLELERRGRSSWRARSSSHGGSFKAFEPPASAGAVRLTGEGWAKGEAKEEKRRKTRRKPQMSAILGSVFW